MFKTKRRRAVVLALIAFFCTAATTYVSVDWKRFGGGVLAYFKGQREPRLASLGPVKPSGQGGARSGAGGHAGHAGASLPQLAAVRSHAQRVAAATPAVKTDDLFAYGDPAAGIPPGSFIVAANDAPGAGGGHGGGAAAPAPGPAAPDGAVAPYPTNIGSSDNGLPGHVTATPTPAPPPVTEPPVPDQSGSTDSNSPPPPPPPPAPPPPVDIPVTPVPPVSAVPEPSSLAMMGLAALFLAVAAQRRRKSS